MEIDPIQNQRRSGSIKKTLPQKKSFKKVLSGISKTDPDESKKKKDEETSPLINGPVNCRLLPNSTAEEIQMGKASLSNKLTSQMIAELKPKLITISESGISKTTMWLKTDLLEEIQVEIDHYDTDPSKFYLTFRGNEKSQKILAAHQNQLATSLKGALPNFHCKISPPSYPEEFSKRKKIEKNKKNSLVKTQRVRYSANNSEG